MIILYADDDADDQEIFGLALKEINPSYQPLYASDGHEAIRQLERLQNPPSLIFLDINMPIMNGTECLMHLKADDRWKHTPVIIYTTTSDEEEQRNHLSLGASYFVTKSNSVDGVRESINKILKNKNS